MKKLVGIFMVMVFLVSMNVALADRIVKDYGSRVQDFVEEWMRIQNKDEKYFKRTTDDNGYYYGYGALSVKEFENHYGIEWNDESMCKMYSEEYENLEIDIKTIGFYEGYNVYLMKAKSTDPIGYVYEYGEAYPFYMGEMIYMAYVEP